jgi:outer membrane protein assembly factor BamB
MNKLAGAVALLVLTVLLVRAQPPEPIRGRFYTTPSVPPREVLDKLNLKLAWRVFVPCDGRRDGIFSVQVLPEQILVQTYRGTVTALDPRTGAAQWRTHVGGTYQTKRLLGVNDTTVFAIRSDRIYALDRNTGQRQWEAVLPNVAIAEPVADEAFLFLQLGGQRLGVFALPEGPTPVLPLKSPEDKKPEPTPRPEPGGSSALTAAVQPAGGGESATPRAPARLDGSIPLELLWDYRSTPGIVQPPLLTGAHVFFVQSNGYAVSSFKAQYRERFHFEARGDVLAPLGQYGETAYMASEDYNVYAIDMTLGQVLWNFITGGPVRLKPVVTTKDVFVLPERNGLIRLDRDEGTEVWRNARAERFLSVNRKFVYAADASNRLMILDYVRGTELAGLDTRDFVVPVANEWTDRLFLASNDGQLACLHDREYPTPLRTKVLPKVKKPEAKPKAEEPDEDKKEDKAVPDKGGAMKKDDKGDK